MPTEDPTAETISRGLLPVRSRSTALTRVEKNLTEEEFEAEERPGGVKTHNGGKSD